MAFYSIEDAKRILATWLKDWSSPKTIDADVDWFHDWTISKEYTAYVFTPPGRRDAAYLVDGGDVLELGPWRSTWEALSALRARRHEAMLAQQEQKLDADIDMS